MKNVRRFGLAMACVAAFLGTPAAAANWVYVTKNDSGTIYYYDADNIQRSGNQITAWQKWDHSADQSMKEREAKRLVRFDCAARTATQLSSIRYFADGTTKSLQLLESEQKTNIIAPETIGETLLEAVCKSK